MKPPNLRSMKPRSLSLSLVDDNSSSNSVGPENDNPNKLSSKKVIGASV